MSRFIILALLGACLAGCEKSSPKVNKWRAKTIGYAYGKAFDGTTLHYRIIERHGDQTLVFLCDNRFVINPNLWPTAKLVETTTKCEEDE